MRSSVVRDDLSAALADPYVIERELGRGGMATVYVADDRRRSESGIVPHGVLQRMKL